MAMSVFRRLDRCRCRPRWNVPPVLAALVLAPLIVSEFFGPPPVRALDPRSTEVLLYRCESSLGRRDVTLFGNGTVRLRQGAWAEQEMRLHELTPEELAAALGQIERALDDDDEFYQRLPDNALAGEWVESCLVRVELADRPRFHYDFARYDVPPLEVARLMQIADALAERTRPLDRPLGLPKGYQPRAGDVLIDRNGLRYQVLGLTSDKQGVELQDELQPLRRYHAIDALREVFVAVERRER